MGNFEFKSAICTSVEQSKRLLELGLKNETADCQYAALIMDWKGNPISNPKWRFYDHNKSFIVQNFEQMECIPAWSLHRLIEILSYTPELSDFATELQYDAMIIHIANAIEANNINKDYLENEVK